MSEYEVIIDDGVLPFFLSVAVLSAACAFPIGRAVAVATVVVVVFPEWTFRFEMARAAMRALRGGIFAPNVVRSRNARYFCRQFELLGKLVGPKSCQRHVTTMETVTLNGQEHVWIRDHDCPRKADANKNKNKQRYVVLYYHGGGFVIMRDRFPEDEVDDSVSIECFLANYRKSPDHKYPIPQQDALLAFEYVVQHEQIDPSRIVLMGDSAGAGLSMPTLLRIKEKYGSSIDTTTNITSTSSHMPAGAMLSCPFVDLAADVDADDSHCMLTMELGREMMKAFHPTPLDPATWKDAAAMCCDPRGLPPAIIQVGTVDTIYKSSVKLHEKAQADGLGSTWELDVSPHMPHAFTCLSETLLPDAKRGIDHLAEFAVRTLVKRNPL